MTAVSMRCSRVRPLRRTLPRQEGALAPLPRTGTLAPLAPTGTLAPLAQTGTLALLARIRPLALLARIRHVALPARIGARAPLARIGTLAPLALAALLGVAPAAHAHKASDAYLLLQSNAGAARLRVDLALRDLDAALGLDADADGRITWGEVRAAWGAVDAYLQAHLHVAGCRWSAPGHALERRSDGAYAALTFTGRCAAGVAPVLRYTAFAEVDPTHRGIARIVVDGGDPVAAVLDPARPSSEGAPAAGTRPASFVAEGVRHIATGWDHLVFLLCLLLPSAMRREAPSARGNAPGGTAWHPVRRWRDALLPVLGIVTAFTVAHTLTLALAAWGRVRVAPTLVEPAIAATIVVAALDNLRPLLPGPRAAAAFAFGLVHGFGFAGVLAELDLPAAGFAWALLQFNVGLELGQAALVAAATAALFALRRCPGYAGWVIRGGSIGAALLGIAWLADRTVGLPAWLL